MHYLLLPHNKLPQHLAALLSFHSICGSAIWEQDRLQSRCPPRLQSSQDSTGLQDPHKVVHSHVWQVGVGYWQEALVPSHFDLSIGLLECPKDIEAGFPQSKKSKLREEATMTFSSPTFRNHTSSFLQYSIGYTHQPYFSMAKLQEAIINWGHRGG